MKSMLRLFVARTAALAVLAVGVNLLVAGAILSQASGEEPKQGDQKESAPSPLEKRAEEMVDQLVAQKFDAAAKDFDETMLKALPPAKLGATWSTLQLQAGKFKQRVATRIEKSKVKDQEISTVFVTCEFEKANLDAKIVYTAAGKVTGLFFVPAKPAFAGKEDLWLGELNTGGAKLKLMFHIGKSKDGKDLASFDSLSQGQKNIPFDKVTVEKESVRLESTALKAVFEGKTDEAKTELKGEWRQGGAKFPLTLKKVDSEPQANRPQTPRAPFPYQAIEVNYENVAGGVKLAGTLTVPAGKGPHPAAVMITGSGAQDRDETIFEHKPFWVIADYLSRRGIAVLRVDDRGVGGSTRGAEEATTADFAGDVQAGIEFLKTRTEIDPHKIGLIGHSEGGVIAPLVASQSKDVAFVVMLAGTGMNGKEVLFQQGAALMKAAGAKENTLAAQKEMQTRMFQILDENPDTTIAVEKIQKSINEYLDGLDAETVQSLGNPRAAVAAQAAGLSGKWFRFFLGHDPRASLEKTNCPVLAICGEKDLQVLPQEHLPAIKKALEAGGNADFEILELPGLNHLFQHCETGAIGEYGQIEETFSPEALKLVGDWIVKRMLPGAKT